MGDPGTKMELRCYSVEDAGIDAATVGSVKYNMPVNGFCAIPTGKACDPKKSVAPCRPGTVCSQIEGRDDFACQPYEIREEHEDDDSEDTFEDEGWFKPSGAYNPYDLFDLNGGLTNTAML